MSEAYDPVMRVTIEDHPAREASGGRLLALLEGLLKASGLSLLGLCAFVYLDLWVYGINDFTLQKHTSGGALRLEARSQYAKGQSMGWIEIPRLGSPPSSLMATTRAP